MIAAKVTTKLYNETLLQCVVGAIGVFGTSYVVMNGLKENRRQNKEIKRQWLMTKAQVATHSSDAVTGTVARADMLQPGDGQKRLVKLD